jgi:hypothetical protein
VSAAFFLMSACSDSSTSPFISKNHVTDVYQSLRDVTFKLWTYWISDAVGSISRASTKVGGMLPADSVPPFLHKNRSPSFTLCFASSSISQFRLNAREKNVAGLLKVAVKRDQISFHWWMFQTDCVLSQ